VTWAALLLVILQAIISAVLPDIIDWVKRWLEAHQRIPSKTAQWNERRKFGLALIAAMKNAKHVAEHGFTDGPYVCPIAACVERLEAEYPAAA
jgi:hypothetical protein